MFHFFVDFQFCFCGAEILSFRCSPALNFPEEKYFLDNDFCVN